MRFLKIIGIAAVAAMAMTAVAGVGTAPAVTKLCAQVDGTNGNGCPGQKREPGSNVHIEAKATNTTLTTSITNFTCAQSVMTLQANTSTNEEPSTSITGAVTGLSFTGCKTNSGTSCTVQVLGLTEGGTYPSHFLGTVDGLTDDSRLQVTGGKASFVCGFLINCTFWTNNAILNGANGTPTTLSASKVKTIPEGGFCPVTAEWDATYSVVTPAGFTVH